MDIDVTNPTALRAALAESLRLSATPLDFATLIREGILGTPKRGWYEIRARLPEHASQQVSAMKTVRKNGKSQVFVRFEQKHAQAARLYRKVTGTPFKAG